MYETAFRDAARETGELFLAGGDVVGAWPYFKAIGEQEPVAAAIENVTGGENLDRVIEIAFREGVNPRKGFELLLEHHGICSAITWYGSSPDYTRPSGMPAAIGPHALQPTGSFIARDGRSDRRRHAPEQRGGADRRPRLAF